MENALPWRAARCVSASRTQAADHFVRNLRSSVAICLSIAISICASKSPTIASLLAPRNVAVCMMIAQPALEGSKRLQPELLRILPLMLQCLQQNKEQDQQRQLHTTTSRTKRTAATITGIYENRMKILSHHDMGASHFKYPGCRLAKSALRVCVMNIPPI